ncbi:hypothetical protein BHE74_00045839 [Ensete ventricosum]|nr:hypothetical protein BHE74_00045839 [Ensete ventricosum]RZS21917.1 hypothetical protein BHM03_00054628 [Ensete ventricosum]
MAREVPVAWGDTITEGPHVVPTPSYTNSLINWCSFALGSSDVATMAGRLFPSPGTPLSPSKLLSPEFGYFIGIPDYLEEARDKMATAKDEAMDNIKAKERLEVLRMELKDTHRQLGEVIEKGHSLEERLSMNFD